MADCMRCGLRGGADVTHACTAPFTVGGIPIYHHVVSDHAEYDRGRDHERARVVAWLRREGRYSNPWNLDDVADAIIRGEHMKPESAA